MRIRQAVVEDSATVLSIATQTFVETFAASNTEEDLEKYVRSNLHLERIESELRHPESMFFLAMDGDQPVGYLKLNGASAQTELQDGESLEIERIYVAARYHGKSLGQKLYDKALDVARQQGKTSLWLGVWEKNPRAIRFYEKNGFVAFGQHIFRMGDDEQIDVMMRKELSDQREALSVVVGSKHHGRANDD